MHKLLRYYSQNRIKIWATILAVIFLIAIIQVLNNISKENKPNEQTNEETALNVVSSQHNESKSIVSSGNVSTLYQEGFNDIINQFYTYCVNHKPDMAYELLAPDTKNVLYPTLKQFENLYYDGKFEGNKKFSFQSWTKDANGIYVYQVKIYEDMLSTGKVNGDAIQDYVTIVADKGSYLLNINSYIGRKIINKKNNNDKVSVEVAFRDTYMDYEIYTLRIKNNADERILLDTRKDTDSIYITDDRGNKFPAFLYENIENDLLLEPQEAKTIQIKFSDAYQSNIEIKSIDFTDIVVYDKYVENNEIETDSLKIELD